MRENSGARVARVVHWPVLALLTASAVIALRPYGHDDLSAAPGSLDPSFGTGGRVITAVATGPDSVVGLARQSDGRIVAAGSAASAGGSFTVSLARYNLDGTLDSSFGTGGIARTELGVGGFGASDVVIQPDGRIIVAGNHSGDPNAEEPIQSMLVRYNADGSLDTTFGNDGLVVTPFPEQGSSLLLQPDGAIVLGGPSPWSPETGTDFALARYTPDGTLDPSFGDGGRARAHAGTMGDYLAALALQADGRIVAAGSNSDFLFARFMPDGSLDPSFGIGGATIVDVHNDSGTAQDLAIQADGKIVAMGWATRWDTSIDFYVLRLNTNGALDASFDGDGKAAVDFAGSADYGHAMTLDGVGRIVLAGTTYTGQTLESTVFALARLSADGSLDASFGTNGRMTTTFPTGGDAITVLLQPDGKIVAGGRRWLNETTDYALARYDGGIPHALALFPHAGDVPPPVPGTLAMTPAPPPAQPLTVAPQSVTWLSDPPVNGTFPTEATFRFVTPCTTTSHFGKTVLLASTDLAGGNEQPLGTGQSAGACGRTETIVIPVATPLTLTNRRLKLTVTTTGSGTGLHLQLGARTFVSATAFTAQP